MVPCTVSCEAQSGVVTGPWPGSCLHLVRTLSHPRWEDFDYTELIEDETLTRFHWLGNGLTYAEKTMQGDRKFSNIGVLSSNMSLNILSGAWYLNEVDYPPGMYAECLLGTSR